MTSGIVIRKIIFNRKAFNAGITSKKYIPIDQSIKASHTLVIFFKLEKSPRSSILLGKSC